MSRNITIITAFFDIGRGQIKNSDLVRSNKKYFDNFEFWARMRNKLIVYTEAQFADEVRERRAKYGLADKTTVVVIEDVFAVEREIFDRMTAISNRQDFRDYRFYNNAMSNGAPYDYIMLMKYYFLKEAVNAGLVEDMAAWVDFGLNHGGELYANPEEFDFEWNYDFSDKIHVITLKDPDKELSIRNLQLQTDCIMGGILVMPKALCEDLWNLVRNAMIGLLALDCIDDDQELLLMAYRTRPELFEKHPERSYLLLKECGNENLTLVHRDPPKIPKIEIIKKPLRRWLKRTKQERFYARIRTHVESQYGRDNPY